MFRLGDRRTFGHRQRTVGVTAMRDGELFGITTIDLGTADGLFARGRAVPPEELLTAVTMPGGVGAPRSKKYSIGGLTEIDLLLGVTIRRFTSGRELIYGRVTAVRGRALIKVEDQSLPVTQMIEVVFDANKSKGGASNPVLAGEESGSLVTTWDGRVVGLLVAGLGHVGFVAPLHGFLASSGYELCEISADSGLGTPSLAEAGEEWEAIRRTMTVNDAAIDSLGAELGREGSLDLPVLRGRAA